SGEPGSQPPATRQSAALVFDTPSGAPPQSGPRCGTGFHIPDRRATGRAARPGRTRGGPMTGLIPEPSDRRQEILALGRLLFEAEAERRPVPQVSTGRPWLGQDEAYQVQQEIVRRR